MLGVSIPDLKGSVSNIHEEYIPLWILATTEHMTANNLYCIYQRPKPKYPSTLNPRPYTLDPKFDFLGTRS